MRGKILQDDAARLESKRIADNVTYTDVHTTSDRAALKNSLQRVLPVLPSIDSLYDGRTWVDTIVIADHAHSVQTTSHVYGDNAAVERPVTVEESSNTIWTFTVHTGQTYAGRAAWELVKEADRKGKRTNRSHGGSEINEERTERYYFDPVTNAPLGYTRNIVRFRAGIRTEIKDFLVVKRD
jgi:hypothetical protein